MKDYADKNYYQKQSTWQLIILIMAAYYIVGLDWDFILGFR